MSRTDRSWITDSATSAASGAPVLDLPFREWAALLHDVRKDQF